MYVRDFMKKVSSALINIRARQLVTNISDLSIVLPLILRKYGEKTSFYIFLKETRVWEDKKIITYFVDE